MKANEHYEQDELQIVAMHLGDEVFGIDIAHIHTVITPQQITPVPQTPPYVKGVMNLRGRILPVIDLRTRFKIPGTGPAGGTRIVIVEVEGLSAGLVVDNVSEVLRLSTSDIQPPSGLLNAAEMEVITGIGRMPVHNSEAGEECFVILLDIQKVLTTEGFDASCLAGLSGAA
jgi:purine-binding chemotaxis protein CheW